LKQLEIAFEQLNIETDVETIAKFEKYMKLVLDWNNKINLTAITDEADFIKKHFIDSVLCVDFEQVKKAGTFIDVGTGAGFPGVPLALIFPDKQFLLMDSVGKKIKVVSEMLEELGILNVKTVHARAEDLAHKKEYREKFDICVSRAVANLATLSEYCLPFVNMGGAFISYKGSDIDDELKNANNAIEKLGGQIVDVRKVTLSNFELDHNIITITKVRQTPVKYPRKAGMPTKQPL